ncbi:hypothetical protein JRO89_XS09G0041000 [Xanthoceras sorbifolium]|uniref:Zinc knuckle CX2CX4HX4C domain-containing protein n=1 Tax=Xanthoceras sorbifolium TaxID=99658 RepID=A0ABQ8HKI7_9ROSI|nr:hypothetical protein JRO89_XS09G0041000 [Xanthoceras sorbifolium]
MMCMTLKIGQFLGDQIGSVREVDAGAFEDCLGKYIRVRVEIDIGKPLQRFLKVNLGSSAKDVVMLLSYERLPEYCFECGMMGHSIREYDCGLGPGGRGKDEVAYGLWMREASSLKSLNGRVRGSLSLWRLSARKCQRTSCKGQGILVWSREIRTLARQGPDGDWRTVRGNAYFVFGATPECFVAVVGESGTAGKVDIAEGRRWKRRA